jgi:phosphoglycolate phosphatase-like HAD superfamily hydrolase
MQRAILADLDRFISPSSSSLADTLAQLKQAGKKLFLCTNSGFDYSARVLAHALSPSRCEASELFDVVVCSANKPDFFFSKKPFRQWRTDMGAPSTVPVHRLCKGEVYIQGSAYALRIATGWQGHDVLYLGDNLRTSSIFFIYFFIYSNILLAVI